MMVSYLFLVLNFLFCAISVDVMIVDGFDWFYFVIELFKFIVQILGRYRLFFWNRKPREDQPPEEKAGGNQKAAGKSRGVESRQNRGLVVVLLQPQNEIGFPQVFCQRSR